ncbi:MAG TPA: class I SAM-dependent methyltransferase [Roseococcus sp.]|jgi:predicted O-methyltransferase YrrM|nr:class I SAM-dependent methyltransferase [Roseococcus sp.]
MSTMDQTDQPVEDSLEAMVQLLHEHFFRRPATTAEVERWCKLGRGLPPAEFLRRFLASPGYLRSRGVSSFWAPGHYYSPVVDPSTLGDYVTRARAMPPEALHGIKLDTAAMLKLLDTHSAELAALDLPRTKVPGRRYFVEGGPFPAGDAASLYLMLAIHRPRRIVEIGSGYSTAAMLDFAEILNLEPLFLTCVEPYPERLLSLMQEGDDTQLTLVQRPVQQLTANELVGALEPGDILFIDSTHVLKTGSDVHHEIFNLLPCVKPGVVIHIHDCPYPFEYPEFWVTERNYSWNEAYAIRAFLTLNDSFEVMFWSSLLKSQHGPHISKKVPHYAQNAGSSIWMRRTR